MKSGGHSMEICLPIHGRPLRQGAHECPISDLCMFRLVAEVGKGNTSTTTPSMCYAFMFCWLNLPVFCEGFGLCYVRMLDMLARFTRGGVPG